MTPLWSRPDRCARALRSAERAVGFRLAASSTVVLMAGLVCAMAAWAVAGHVQGQSPTPIIATVAGSFPGDGGPAAAAQLDNPGGIAVDPAGNVYIADEWNNRIRKVSSATGEIVTIAGNGGRGFSGDGGLATLAMVDRPSDVALDGAGNVLFVDYNNHRIRRISAATGVITTVAGNSTPGGAGGFGGDGGPATAAQLKYPRGLVLDSSGNIYIVDGSNCRIRLVVAATGVISTVVGAGTCGFSGDGGPATAALLNYPTRAALDADGNLYVSDAANHRIRRVAATTGLIATVAGTGPRGFSGDGGLATSAQLDSPSALAFDAAGDLVFADAFNNRVRKVSTATGAIATVAGNGNTSFSGDGGPATSAGLDHPEGLAFDGAGTLYLADSYNDRVRAVAVGTGTITTFAGSAVEFVTAGVTGDGGLATSAQLNASDVALDPFGNLYITDRENHRIRKVTPTGVITTAVGTGVNGSGGDGGPAVAATISNPRGPAIDAAGNLYIAGSERIRKVTVGTGLITTVAGSGTLSGYGGDGGPATAATLNLPEGVAVDGTGNIYIADSRNHRIRMVAAGTGIITTIAGTGVSGFSGDGGPATAAKLSYPAALALDGAGHLFIQDAWNRRIRVITLATGVIATAAGTGVSGYSGDGGLATAARIAWPNAGIAADAAGNLFIADSSNHRVRRVDGATGIISTVAGSGTPGLGGDGGAATAAWLSDPRGVAVDGAGRLYIADTANQRIRKVAVPAAPVPVVQPQAQVVPYGATATVSAAASAQPPPAYRWQASTDGGATWTDLADSAVYSGVTTTVLRITAQSMSLSGTLLRLRAVNASGTATSDVAALTVVKATPTITWADPPDMPFGTPLSAEHLNAVASVSGTFEYGPPAGAVLNLGPDQPLSVVFTPNDQVNYTAATSSVTVDVVPIIWTIAGTGTWGSSGDGGPAIAAQVAPSGVATDAAGNLFVADWGRVRKVTAGGLISTIAGTGTLGFSGDGGPATAATMSPFAVAVDGAGNVFVSGDNRVRRVAAGSGVITTIAGTGVAGYSGDGGAGVAAQLSTPEGVAVDLQGNLYVADYYNHCVRRVGAESGTITTVAGTGVADFSGDGGPATAARLNRPTDVAVDEAGNLFVSDSANWRVRRIDAVSGVITTVAGGGSGGDGSAATAAQLISPDSVAVDRAGNIYVADNNRIRKVTAATGLISTVAGKGGVPSYGGDGGAATLAGLSLPRDVLVDPDGNLVIADQYNNRVRKVGLVMPAVDATPPSIVPELAGTVGGEGWYTSDVTLTWTVADGQSMVWGQTGCGGSSIVVDSAGTTFTCSATSVGGTASQSVTIKRDTAPPVVTVTAPRHRGYYGLGAVVPAAYGCVDPAGSGVATCSGSTAAGVPIDMSTTGAKSLVITATDRAGLQTTVVVDYTVTSTPPPLFSDDPLTPGTTPVRAVHVVELRQAIESLRARWGLPAVSWADATLAVGVTPVKAVHVTQLRSAIAEVYVAAGRSGPSHTRPEITGGATLISAVDVADLRAAVLAIW